LKTKEEALYDVLSAKLIEAGVVTERECAIIARRGTRKERFWKRHLLDLAEYAVKQHRGMEDLCNQMIQWCKQPQ